MIILIEKRYKMKTYDFEFEKRAMLDKEQYFNIVLFLNRKYNPKRLFVHIKNEYLDTDDLALYHRGAVLRIRQTISKGIVLTLKTPLVDAKGDLETSQHLSLSDYDNIKNNNGFPNGPIKDKLFELGVSISQIKHQATLMCKRTEIKDGEFVIVLDENTYNDILDYDIEIESSSLEASNKKILEFAQKFNFEVKDFYVSKSRRALETRKIT